MLPSDPNLYPSSSEVLSRDMSGGDEGVSTMCEYRSIGFLWLGSIVKPERKIAELV